MNEHYICSQEKIIVYFNIYIKAILCTYILAYFLAIWNIKNSLDNTGYPQQYFAADGTDKVGLYVIYQYVH